MDETTPSPSPEAAETDALAALTARAEAAETAIAESRASFAGAISAYRDLARSANPSVPGDFIDGDSIDAVNAATEKAKAFAAEVVRLAGVAAGNGHAPTVPIGSQLATADLTGLSPVAKIAMGFAAHGRPGR